MGLKSLCDDCYAICETAAEAACIGCSTITTVKRPTTKCSTAKHNTSYIFTLQSSILNLITLNLNNNNYIFFSKLILSNILKNFLILFCQKYGFIFSSLTTQSNSKKRGESLFSCFWSQFFQKTKDLFCYMNIAFFSLYKRKPSS